MIFEQIAIGASLWAAPMDGGVVLASDESVAIAIACILFHVIFHCNT